MSVEIKVPAAGESVTEAILAEWIKEDGDLVKRDDVLLVLETDKASMEVVAEADGKLQHKVEADETVQVGTVIGVIDTSVQVPKEPKSAPPKNTSEETAPVAASSNGSQSGPQASPELQQHLSPAVSRAVAETGVDPSTVSGTGRGGRLTKGDIMEAATNSPSPQEAKSAPAVQTPAVKGTSERVKMTTIRKRIAERLVEAQQTAAILTTFNEIDMSQIMAVRSEYKDKFEKKYGIRLGFMGLFVKACIEALKEYPAVNAEIDGTDIVYHNFYNVGIAVSTPKGLMVPVIKNADQMSVAEIELKIKEYAEKARKGRITIDDLSGATFTITNGGVFGSLMSTPILTPPQVGILGMHKIEERAVVVNGKVEVRPMMYVALSYDHRIVDGKESVSFLVRVKDCIEDPQRILLEI